jgi:hypothetical protein
MIADPTQPRRRWLLLIAFGVSMLANPIYEARLASAAVLGTLRVQPGSSGRITVAEVIHPNVPLAIRSYVVHHEVYAIRLTPRPSFRPVTQSLGVPRQEFGMRTSGHWATQKDTEFRLTQWDAKPEPGVAYLVIVSATVTLTSGQEMACDFDPTLIVDGKAFEPDWEVEPTVH